MGLQRSRRATCRNEDHRNETVMRKGKKSWGLDSSRGKVKRVKKENQNYSKRRRGTRPRKRKKFIRERQTKEGISSGKWGENGINRPVYTGFSAGVWPARG